MLLKNLQLMVTPTNQKWSRGHKARGQGQGHKKISRPRTDPRLGQTDKFRGQGQGPRTHAQVFSKKKEGLEKFFLSDLKKKGLQKIFFRRFPLEENKKRCSQFLCEFLALSNKILTVQEIVLSSSRGQGNFRGLEASRPRTSKCVLEALRTPPLLLTMLLPRPDLH